MVASSASRRHASRRIVLAQAAPRYKVLAALDAVQGVDLHAAQRLDEVEEGAWRRRWLRAERGREALCVQGDRPQDLKRVGRPARLGGHHLSPAWKGVWLAHMF